MNTQATILYNDFENYTFKIAGTSLLKLLPHLPVAIESNIAPWGKKHCVVTPAIESIMGKNGPPDIEAYESPCAEPDFC